MKKPVVLLLLLLILLTNQVYAEGTRTIQARQKFGGNFVGSIYYDSQNWTAEIQNISKPSLLLGAGPRWKKNFGDNKKIKKEILCFGYLATNIDVSKDDWSAERIEIDTFIIPSAGSWSLFIRTKAQHFFVKQVPCYFGENAICYQASEKWQVQLRSEWKRQKELLPSFGIGWINKISYVSFRGYIGIEKTKNVGWIDLMIKLAG